MTRILAMDIEEFKKNNPPLAKRSRLHRFRDQILSLRDNGYSYSQIADYLAQNGVPVSSVWLGRFINKELAKRGHTAGTAPQYNAAGSAAIPEAGQDPVEYPAHDPRAITQILGSPVDLDELAKYAPKRTREKP